VPGALGPAAGGGVNALARLIARGSRAGPMRVDRFMAACLTDPEHGYYARREPFGRGGDFVTAPEISQMFGELLGLWAAQVWIDIGRPARRSCWSSLGPGRGTLMRDALRAAGRRAGLSGGRAASGFVERSARCAASSARARRRRAFAERLEDAPRGPMILLANEFFDALPIRQFVRQGGAWRERAVGHDPARDALVWSDAPLAADAPQLPETAPDGAVLERCPKGAAVAREIGARLVADGGAALIVDYGAEPPETGGGDTLQAMQGHAFADPLAAPGDADLTAHVDFAALAEALRETGARVPPLETQGALLGRLGVDARAAALMRARPERADEIAAQRRG
jgi:NADH dehydrogenase [ubiquinone] 1 alpha subcomplex assembly factor 7